MLPLVRGFYETAYVTRNMDAALATVADRDGLSDFYVFAPPATRGAVSHLNKVAKTFVGERMIEILEPNPQIESIFIDFLPAANGDLKLHHLGHIVADDAHWDAILDQAAASKIEIAYQGFIPDMIRVVYLDTRAALGHYSEYIQNYAGGRALLERIPRC